MNAEQLCKGIRNQNGSVISQSDNDVRVRWDATAQNARGQFTRDSGGRWSYRGSIK